MKRISISLIFILTIIISCREEKKTSINLLYEEFSHESNTKTKYYVLKNNSLDISKISVNNFAMTLNNCKDSFR